MLRKSSEELITFNGETIRFQNSLRVAIFLFFPPQIFIFIIRFTVCSAEEAFKLCFSKIVSPEIGLYVVI